MLSIGYGGAFLTNDESLADLMEEEGHWNEYYTPHLKRAINGFYEDIQQRWGEVRLWDRYLGDSLIRIPGEQLMPWRVMRRAWTPGLRNCIVRALRDGGYGVGTNYPPLEGSNVWGDTVLNFFGCPAREIQNACEIIKREVEWSKL